MNRRLIGTILAVAGCLLLADVALTIVWREPVTWVLSSGDQADLAGRLERSTSEFGASLPEGADASGRIAAAADAFERQLEPGDPVGRLWMPSLGEKSVIVQGTKQADLRQGPGHYLPTSLPGQGGTVGLAGHRTTYQQPFRSIDALKPNDELIVTMAYGRFTYRVEGTRIVKPGAVGVLTSARGRERLVLTACHPLYSAAKRIVVFARLADAIPLGVARSAG